MRSAIGATWALRAEPERWWHSACCGDGRVLVQGSYTGSPPAGPGGSTRTLPHLWAAEGGRLRSLHQYTDTALWLAALEDDCDRR